MMINPLPNDRIPKPKKRRYATVALKTLAPKINVECEVLPFFNNLTME